MHCLLSATLALIFMLAAPTTAQTRQDRLSLVRAIEKYAAEKKAAEEGLWCEVPEIRQVFFGRMNPLNDVDAVVKLVNTSCSGNQWDEMLHIFMKVEETGEWQRMSELSVGSRGVRGVRIIGVTPAKTEFDGRTPPVETPAEVLLETQTWTGGDAACCPTLIGNVKVVVAVDGQMSEIPVLPFFFVRLLTAADLKGRSARQIELMRNEIFARHGRRFEREDLQEVFSAQPWYRPQLSGADFDIGLLSEIQRQNVAKLFAAEKIAPK